MPRGALANLPVAAGLHAGHVELLATDATSVPMARQAPRGFLLAKEGGTRLPARGPAGQRGLLQVQAGWEATPTRR